MADARGRYGFGGNLPSPPPAVSRPRPALRQCVSAAGLQQPPLVAVETTPPPLSSGTTLRSEPPSIFPRLTLFLSSEKRHYSLEPAGKITLNQPSRPRPPPPPHPAPSKNFKRYSVTTTPRLCFRQRAQPIPFTSCPIRVHESAPEASHWLPRANR